MKILISTFGTRGDVQPYIALGVGLQAAGHTVALFTAAGYQPFVEQYGLQYVFMHNDLLELSQAIIARPSDTRAMMPQMLRAMRQMLMDEWQAAQAFNPDAIVYHPKSLGSYHIAEKLDIPAFLALPLPFYTPTGAFPNPFLAGVHLGPWVNRFTFHLLGLTSAMYVGMTNDFRRGALGLSPRRRFADPFVTPRGQPVTILYPYSPHLLPVPADFPAHVHVTGSWFLDTAATWQPDPALERFLASGPPPVYVGFGSMSGSHTEAHNRGLVMLEDELHENECSKA